MIVFTDMVGIGLIIPVMPDLLAELGALDLGSAAAIGGWLVFAYTAAQLVAAPLLGWLSDRVGRKQVIVVALVGLMLDYLVMYFAASLLVLFIGRIVAGACGATFPIATAYMADISRPENRTANFGLIEAAAGIGLIAGPAIGGAASMLDARAPFLVAALLIGMNIACVLVFLEGRPAETPTGAGRDAETPLRLRPLLAVGSVFLLAELAIQALPATWAYFVMLAFGWSAVDTGLSIAAYGICSAIAQIFILPFAAKRIGNKATVAAGLAAGAGAFALLAIASQPWAVAVGLAVGAAGTIAFPALKAMASREAPDEAQGRVQGLLAGATSLAILAGSVAMTQVFAAFTPADRTIFFPGAPFVLASIVFIVALLLLLFGAGQSMSKPGRSR